MTANLHPESSPEPKPHDSDATTPDESDTESIATTEHDDDDHDGFRPSRLEIRQSRSRTSSINAGPNRSRTSLGPRLSRPATLPTVLISHIRSRPAGGYAFTHPLSHVPTTKEHLVEFNGPDDPYKPVNWPIHKKVVTTALYGLVTMTSTWASASYAPGTRQVADEFGVGTQVAVLGTSLFLIGFGVGPLLWAPLSEVYGRRIAVFVPMFIAICFSFGSATAKDLQTLMLTRFFAAFFASAPVTNTGGVLGDLYSPAYRGVGIAGYAMAVVGGPSIGPIVSAALVSQPNLGWRWSEYLTGILQAFVLTIAVIFIDETYPPKLLVNKARRLRIETGNWALHAKFEEWDVSINELARKFLVRPVQLLCTPICFLMATYASFCYGIIYMQLGSIPIIFGEVRGWSLFVSTLPFVCILLGAILGCVGNVWNSLVYNRYYQAAGNRAVPERRLPPMMVGSVLFAGGQFVTGWTANPKIHWIVPCIGLVLLGTGFFMIFQGALNYLVDTFQMYAASAVAANTFLRSCFACAFPLVVGPMYHNLGVGPGSSIPAGFAVLLIPVPFVFFAYGKRIRARSKWSKASVFD
ncbi:major facilitator superfamily domain-containing protein [Echria macrotheca]|uniref:Major facilitator superfamily domain-containing protein n=1 Tax=Echria macrotheca TaxID=438768 RepID=A0AAJ0BLW9_9PEZI|nr:major facilitator superfamily domain-containing protein [Echria macrotheca]